MAKFQTFNLFLMNIEYVFWFEPSSTRYLMHGPNELLVRPMVFRFIMSATRREYK